MIDIALFLEPLGLQLAVMPEIGNATAGSVACCGTKDSSFKVGGDNGLSQVSSTVVAVKMVNAKGDVENIDETSDPQRMRLIRSSYGLLGIICEVTFKTEPLTFARYTYEIIDLTPSLPTLDKIRDGVNSVLGFMHPYEKQILVERRTLVDPVPENSLPLDEQLRSANRKKTWNCKAATLNRTKRDWHRDALVDRSRVVTSVKPSARSSCAKTYDSGDSP